MQPRKNFRYRILLVDDAPALRELGKLLLEAQGYEVLCAEDGFEGLAALKAVAARHHHLGPEHA